MKLSKTTKGFFAYSTEPPSSGDAIEYAIKELNKGGLTKITSWKDLRINGKLIISEILTTIDNSDYVCADLTGLNDNVLFEVGYAISRRKPVWLIFDISYTDYVRKFRELGLLNNIGYTIYSNTQNVIDAFYTDKIYESTESLYDQILTYNPTDNDRKAVLFLRSQVSTNSSQVIIDEFQRLKLPYIMDDAVETKVQPISWYADQLFKVPAVLAQFSSTQRSGYELQNSKASFVSGLALGLGLKVLMIAETPYDVPLDYRELLKKYIDRVSCQQIVAPFLDDIHRDLGELLTKKNLNASQLKERSSLQKINFGEYIAEHESEKLFDYYVETSHLENLIKTEYNIIIGRKGSGKTAALYYLRDLLEDKKTNHICLIKPVAFEIDGLVSLLENSTEFEGGNLIEAVWKFLIYTEIAKTQYEKIKSKQLYAITDKENEFVDFIEKYQNIILSDFSTRLEEQLYLLVSVFSGEAKFSQNDFKLKISEVLHDGIIYKLREHIADVVDPNHKIIVLIDNLDKSWRKSSNLPILSKCILGLLGVTGRIVKDLQVIKPKKTRIAFHLTLFLRSDIFSHVLKYAREPDKIEFTKLRYNDPEIFFRIIEERFVQLNDKQVVPEDLWLRYIVPQVNNVPIKEYIYNNVIPRPRDIIFLLKAAKDFAVSRGHVKILENDMISAYKEYSSWVFTSLLAENGVTLKQMEEFMYQLVGCDNIISLDQIKKMMKESGIDAETELQIEEFVDQIVSLSILGREIKKGIYDFEYDFDTGLKNKALARKCATNNFKVHNALIPYLECNVIT